MTTQQKRAIAIGAITTLLGATLIGAAAGAASAVRGAIVTRGEFEALRATVERVDARTARIERFICRPRPDDLGCQP